MEDHSSLFGRGYEALSSRRYEEAETAFKEAIRLKPETWSSIGFAYRHIGRYEEAVAAHKEAIRLNPDDAKAHFGLGVAYIDIGNREAALEQYEILKS